VLQITALVVSAALILIFISGCNKDQCQNLAESKSKKRRSEPQLYPLTDV
jgi:hypothetical protein